MVVGARPRRRGARAAPRAPDGGHRDRPTTACSTSAWRATRRSSCSTSAASATACCCRPARCASRCRRAVPANTLVALQRRQPAADAARLDGARAASPACCSLDDWRCGACAAGRQLARVARPPRAGRRRHRRRRSASSRSCASAGLTIEPLPLPDHHAFDALPWPAGTADVVRDREGRGQAAPARRSARTRVWVAPLDFELDLGFAAAIKRLFPNPPSRHHLMAALDHRLIELLVCPLCKGKLVMLRDAEQRPTRAGLPRRPPGVPDPRRHPGDARGRGATTRRRTGRPTAGPR